MRQQIDADSRRFGREFLFCLFCLSLLIFLFSACQKNGSSSSGGLLSSDDTDEAVSLITEANGDLKKIKAIYKANQGRVEELQAAMSNKEIDTVKKIADDLVFQINDGISLGENAVSKIEKAEALNTNDSFKEYLALKKESLRKQLEAFEFRRQSAQLLRDAFGGKNPQEIEKVKAVFREKEGSFQKLMEEGREQSQEANLLAKESQKKAQ